MHILLEDVREHYTSRRNHTLEQLLRETRQTMDRSISFYHSGLVYADATHPLTRLAYLIPVQSFDSVIDAYQYGLDNQYDLAHAIDITTPLQAADPFEDLSYPNTVEYWFAESILAASQIFEAGEDLGALLDRVRPLRLYDHPYVLNIGHVPLADQFRPDDKTTRLASFSVDIPAFCVYFYAWLKEVRELEPIGEKSSRETFIGSWVLPTVLGDQYDISLMNAVLALSGNDYPSADTPRYVVGSDHMERILGELSDRLLGQHTASLEYGEMLGYVPSVEDSLTWLDRRVELTPNAINYRDVELADLKRLYFEAIVSLGKEEQSSVRPKLRRMERYWRNRRVLATTHSENRYTVSDQFDIIQAI